VPDRAPHRALGERFAAFLVSPEGRELLRREGLDALSEPVAHGARAAWMPGAAADVRPGSTP
jgi:hypothetical protein